ncbi:hypothetical protein EDD99_0498 [Streptomyces sp. 846.5]|nr:SAV_2336 N-terminal domain-related protein [Streptomyces sp. 846.5]TDU02113.1 hypothetical protein EDD99_0498 [Streptomyces sp. 846.5]
MYRELSHCLGQESGDLTPAELLDILWLAGRMPPAVLPGAPHGPDGHRGIRSRRGTASAPDRPRDTRAPEGAAEEEADPGSSTHPDSGPGAPEVPAATRAPSDASASEIHASPRAEPESAASPAPEAPRKALPVSLPRPRTIPEPLRFARQLRPLKRNRPALHRRLVDEQATVERAAQAGVVDVVLRPDAERWLDVVLVVDESTSMLLWRDLSAELHLLLERLGAFRTFRVLGLRLRQCSSPVLTCRPFSDETELLDPGTIRDPSGRTLTLVLSDGAAPEWRGAELRRIVARWASCGPTAVVHALPSRMWPGSGLSVQRWEVTNPYPGAPNTVWRVSDPLLPPEVLAFHGVPVPVLEVGPDSLGTWARLTTTAEGRAVLPLWDLTERPEPTGDAVPPQFREHPQYRSLGAEQHLPAQRGRPTVPLRAFRNAASPEAYRLAGCLAALVPLTVPAMRLVAQAVQPPLDSSHLAEVFLSGLFRQLIPPDASPGGAEPPEAESRRTARRSQADSMLFTFDDIVQDILLDAVPTAEILETTRRVSDTVAELLGRSPDFAAWLSHRDGPDELPDIARAFAWLSAPLLARLGLTADPRTDDLDEPDVPEIEPPEQARNPLSPYFDGWDLFRASVNFDRETPRPGYIAPYISLVVGDRYRLGARMAESTTTDVYAGATSGGTPVAVRIAWHNRPRQRGAARRRIAAEGAALSAVAHPCLPVLLDFGPGGDPPATDLPWLAMTLGAARSGRRPLTLRELMRHVRGTEAQSVAFHLAHLLADALTVCHAAGVVHGRLTADRVLMTGTGPLIVGWGAHSSAAEPADDLLALGQLMLQASAPPSLWQDDPTETALADTLGRLDPGLTALIRGCLRTSPSERLSAPELRALAASRLTSDSIGQPIRELLPAVAQELLDAGHTPAPPITGLPGPPPEADRGRQSRRAIRRLDARANRPDVLAPAIADPVPRKAPATRAAAPGGTLIWHPGNVGPVQQGRRRKHGPVPTPGPAHPTVMVYSVSPAVGCSTVAVQLGSALAVLGRKQKPQEHVLMLLVDRSMGVLGYRAPLSAPDLGDTLLLGPQSPSEAVTPPEWISRFGHRPPPRWLTRQDSNGLHIVYRTTDVLTVMPMGTRTVRESVDELRHLGLVLLAYRARGRSPDEFRRDAKIDRLVVATDTRPGSLRAVRTELDRMRESFATELTRDALVVVSDLCGAESPAAASTIAEHLGIWADQAFVMPYDPTLGSRGLVDHAELDPTSRRAYRDLARAVHAGLPPTR